MSSLGNDLSRLRKEQDLTLEEVRDQTKISLKVLKSIEDDTIFTDFNENRTYVRSFVRSFAKALGIDNRIIRIALDQTEAGQYQDLLQKVDPYQPGEITDDPPFTIPDAQKRKKSRSKGKGKRTTKALSDQRETRHDPQSIKDYSNRDTRPSDSINWADVGQRFKSMENGSKVWLVILAVVLVSGASGYYLFYQPSDQPQSPMAADSLASLEQEISSSDSLQMQMDTATAPATVSSTNNPEVLPDTLQLIVYAAQGKLEPVRVKSDLFSETFPYWLEQGTAMRFNFVDSIKIRGQYNRMALIVNGRQIPDFLADFYNKPTQELHIYRQYFEEDPKWNQPVPDSLILDTAEPDTIINRPVFNE